MSKKNFEFFFFAKKSFLEGGGVCILKFSWLIEPRFELKFIRFGGFGDF